MEAIASRLAAKNNRTAVSCLSGTVHSLSMQSYSRRTCFQWSQSIWHNPREVVYMDPLAKDILVFVESTLKPLWILFLLPNIGHPLSEKHTCYSYSCKSYHLYNTMLYLFPRPSKASNSGNWCKPRMGFQVDGTVIPCSKRRMLLSMPTHLKWSSWQG